LIVESQRKDLQFNAEDLKMLEDSDYLKKELAMDRMFKFFNEHPIYKDDLTHL
jgi:hypothetical protein